MGDSDPSSQNGLNLNELKLVSHNPQWASMYAEEAGQLRQITGLCEIMQIGSTALPNVDTKPIIDIAALVDDSPEDESLRSALEGFGYKSYGEYGLPGRQFFTKGSPTQFHLHVVDRSSKHWDDWKVFKDYLLAHGEWREKYQAEKHRIAEMVEWNRKRYTEEKTDFINMILEMAREK